MSNLQPDKAETPTNNFVNSCVNKCASMMENSVIYKENIIPLLKNAKYEYAHSKKILIISYGVHILLLLVIICLLYKIYKK